MSGVKPSAQNLELPGVSLDGIAAGRLRDNLLGMILQAWREGTISSEIEQSRQCFEANDFQIARALSAFLENVETNASGKVEKSYDERIAKNWYKRNWHWERFT